MRLKHFLRLADALRSCRPSADWKHGIPRIGFDSDDRMWRRTVESIARMLDDYEPRFDIEQWLAYVLKE